MYSEDLTTTTATDGTFRVVVRSSATGTSDKVVISGPISVEWISVGGAAAEQELVDLAFERKELCRPLLRVLSLVIARHVQAEGAPECVLRPRPRIEQRQRCATRAGPRYRRHDRRTGRVFVPPSRA